ncbi:Rieske (2Fe-2S) protein [Knoellia sp. S7-12]|uniref:Rieske (2Fe-2S) protein n=1 Tax=Knoellia sp. S7-12 TaxID=3126698 RepID=UPI003367CE5D
MTEALDTRQAASEAEPAPLSCCGRREALRAVGVVAIAGAGLTACGTSADDVEGATDAASSAASSAASGAVGAVKDLAKKAEIPVGGGKVIESAKVVITQPTAGEYKAFSAVCTHQGCTVSGVADGTINCACHGSKFDIATGEVKQGPATSGLPTKSATVGADGISVT